jgi:hypothetical protein
LKGTVKEVGRLKDAVKEVGTLESAVRYIRDRTSSEILQYAKGKAKGGRHE